MTFFVITAFYCSFLLVTVSRANRATSVQNDGNGTTAAPQDHKCSTVINGNYYAGTNKEIKTILHGIQAQLSDVQDQLREMNAANENKIGEKEEIVTNRQFISLAQMKAVVNSVSLRFIRLQLILLKQRSSDMFPSVRFSFKINSRKSSKSKVFCIPAVTQLYTYGGT